MRSRWSTLRLHLTGWLVVAAGIWIFVKLPQEYWIHVAQLDVTDTLEDYAWAWPLLIGLMLVLAGVLWFVVRPRTPAPDWDLRLAADALPAEMDEAAERTAWHVEHGRVWSTTTLEKVMLVGLLSVIFSQTLPGTSASQHRALRRHRRLRRRQRRAGARRGPAVRRARVGAAGPSPCGSRSTPGLVLVGWVLLGRGDLERQRRALLRDAAEPAHDAARPVAARARRPRRSAPTPS